MKAISWSFAVSLLCMSAGPAFAAGDSEVDDLRREIRALRSEVQGLRLVLSELAELDRQRANAISRALEGSGGSGAVGSDRSGSSGSGRVSAVESPAVERRGGDTKLVSTETSKAEPQVSEASSRRNVKAASNGSNSSASSASGGGTVTGRVSIPEGEPVGYVYVENVYGAPLKNESVVIEQSKKQFSPGWAVIQKGTTVKFPNLDNIYHNVFSRSPGNSFDLGMYNSSDEPKSHTFFEPGPVDVYCNIHPRMSASVLVVPNRHFVKVKADGTFQLDGVPAGKRKVVAWAPGSVASSEWVEVEANGRAELALKLQPKSGGHKNKEGRAYTSYE